MNTMNPKIKQNKKNIYFVFILGLLLFTINSCNKEEENNQLPVQTPVNNTIFDKWKLVRFRPGFPPITTYDGNQIIWKINQNNTIDVTILSGTNISPGMLLSTNGNYPYVINNNQLILEGDIHDFTLNNNDLIITLSMVTDGSKYEFKRIQ